MRLTVTVLCLLLIAPACSRTRDARTMPEILGIRLGATKGEAHSRLEELGRLEREERKQQEVWALNNDPSYSHLIISYDREHKGVRFVTAVAKEDGRRVRYSDVVDTAKASRAAAGSNVTYTVDNPGEGEGPAYVVRAIGSDPQFLKYYSIKLTGPGGAEDEEEEEREKERR